MMRGLTGVKQFFLLRSYLKLLTKGHIEWFSERKMYRNVIVFRCKILTNFTRNNFLVSTLYLFGKKKWCKFSFTWLILISFLFSCVKSKHRGYSYTETGLYYHHYTLGEGEKHPQSGNYVTFNLSKYTLGDTLIETNDSLLCQLSNLKDSALHESLSMMLVGDSSSFIFSDSLFKREIKHNIKLIRVQTAVEYEEEQAYLVWKRESVNNEDTILSVYLTQLGIADSSDIEGIYFIPIRKGRGGYVLDGDIVTIHYNGYFLDSTLFDSTYELDQPMEFNYGDPEQVIKGIEIGLSMMKKEAKAKIIIPSRLAFGEKGSSSGIVPPFTPVVFEVELVNKTGL